MIGQVFENTIEAVKNGLNNLIKIFLDHNHDGINSKKVHRDSDVVYLTGDQTIGGVKTFTSLPKVPTTNPTDNAEVISKDYFDDTAMFLNRAENVLAQKTFIVMPKIPTTDPTDVAHPISKNYYDANTVTLSGDQTISDIKTFSSFPKIPTTDPTDDAHPISKYYYDNNNTGNFDTSKVIELTVSDTSLQASADTEGYKTDTTAPTYTKVKEIKIRRRGQIRVKFDACSTSSVNCRARIYINGMAVGTEHLVDNTPYGNWVTFTDDITVAADDLVQLYVRVGAAGQTIYYKNFRLYYDRDYSIDYVVNLD